MPVLPCSNVSSFPPLSFYVLFLAVFKLFFLFQCVTLSVFVHVMSAQGRRRTHHSLRAGKSSTSDLSYWNSDLWVSFRGPSKGWFDVFFSTCTSLSLSLVFVCVVEDGWSGPPSSSSPHGTIWTGSEVMELFFFRVLPNRSVPVVAPQPVCMDACM